MQRTYAAPPYLVRCAGGLLNSLLPAPAHSSPMHLVSPCGCISTLRTAANAHHPHYPLSTTCQGTNSDNDDGDVSLPEDSDTGSEDEPIANRYNGLGKKAPLGKKALSADKNAPSAKVTPPAQTLAATATEKSLPDESDSEKALPVRRDRAKKTKKTHQRTRTRKP